MTVKWIEHPQAGTSIQPGDWLCTVESGQKRIKRSVRILQLDRFGHWTEKGVKCNGRIVAVAFVPLPYQCARLSSRSGLARQSEK